MAEKISILGINGSPHKDGSTFGMLGEVLDSAKRAGAETEVAHLADLGMEIYHGDYEKEPGANTLKFFEHMRKFDGYVFASPVHWLAPSSLMKILIDNLTYFEAPDFPLQGKVFGVVTHCCEDGGFQAGAHILSVLNNIGLVSPPYGLVLRNRNIERNEDTEWMWQDTALLGKNIVKQIKISKNIKDDWGY
ncbi:NAD(P)H-dependent oxidoreductase [Candidatus Giovannonibacteria bacterium]|nr:NAD(P)H-dependent oxidoreductase [Candidatus Giovannonibacteria bacterium]